MSRKIIGIGETVLDIVFRNDQPVAAVPGGSTFNSMISLGRTARRDYNDISVSMVTETGDDHVADIVTSFMKANGVDTEAVTRNEGVQTYISLAFLDGNNDAQYQFFKEFPTTSKREEKLSRITFTKDDLVLFGSYYAINPRIRGYFVSLLQKAHCAGSVLFYDINIRKGHLKEIPQLYGNIKENCLLSDIVRGSCEDFNMLLGTQDPETIYREFIRPLCPVFICTCGPDPVHIFTPGMHLSFPVPQIETVSTIGAGDNFNAGVLYSLLGKDLRRDDIENISEDVWKDISAVAGKFSSEVCGSIENYVGRDFVPGSCNSR